MKNPQLKSMIFQSVSQIVRNFLIQKIHNRKQNKAKKLSHKTKTKMLNYGNKMHRTIYSITRTTSGYF